MYDNWLFLTHFLFPPKERTKVYRFKSRVENEIFKKIFFRQKLLQDLTFSAFKIFKSPETK